MGGENHKSIKVSAKGVQQGGNRNVSVLSPEGFENVVRNRITLSATNKGFRVDKYSKSIITYQQTKIGLNYMYNKRKVLDDGISTTTLGFYHRWSNYSLHSTTTQRQGSSVLRSSMRRRSKSIHLSVSKM